MADVCHIFCLVRTVSVIRYAVAGERDNTTRPHVNRMIVRDFE